MIMETSIANSTITISCIFDYISSGNRNFEIYASSSSSSTNIDNRLVTVPSQTKFILEYFGSGSVYSSTNADTDWASCNFSTLAWQGLGTVTSDLVCKRQGGDLLISGHFTAGTVSAVEARLPLPLWNGIQLTVKSDTKPLTLVGTNYRSSTNATSISTSGSGLNQATANDAFVTFGFHGANFSGVTKQTGSGVFLSSEVVRVQLRIPISTFENSNIIIGSFDGIEKCTDSYECTDTFSAKVSAAGVASDENLDWINGNASVAATNQYTITFKPSLFSVAPNCTVTGSASSAWQVNSLNASASSIRVDTLTNSGNAAAGSFSIICQKQGADYIGKTAKAVASDQNIATPGTIKSTLCSAKVSSTGVITDQKGGCFTSCTNATTPVCTFTSNYWVSSQIPNCWLASDSGGLLSGNIASSTTFSAELRNPGSPGAAAAGARQYFCHGERQ